MDANQFYSRTKVKRKLEESGDGEAGVPGTSHSKRDSFSKLPRVNYSLLGPSQVVRFFNKQDEAIRYRNSDGDLIVFSNEIGLNGARSFLVASPEKFWSDYVEKEVKNYYEVIEAGRSCKFYLDLEFSVTANPNTDGHKLVDTLLDLLFRDLAATYGRCLTRANALILDSTSETKFSHHVILPGLVFANNTQLGCYLGQFFWERLGQQDRNALMVTKEERRKCGGGTDRGGRGGAEVEPKSSFIDLGVYTRNRNFRLLSSCKRGKKAALKIADTDLYSKWLKDNNSSVPDYDLDKHVFLHSLITKIESRTLDDSSVLNCPCHTSSSSSCARLRGEWHHMSPVKQNNDKPPKVYDKISSPFPEIDAFVKTLIQPGFLRKCFHFEEASFVVYEIGGNRYCGNVGREHRSNNVKYICDITREIVYQRCHDPDCRDYRGPEIQIPSNHLPWSNLTDSFSESEEANE